MVRFDAVRLPISLGVALLSGACGGAGYENGVYEDEEARFEIDRPPDGWRAIRVGQEPDLAYHSADLDAVLQVNASCTPALDIPLGALTNQLLAGFTERQLETQETVPFDGREGLSTHLRAKLDGVPRELLVLVTKKNGCVYDFVLVAAPGDRFDRARGVYERLIASFHVDENQGAARRGAAALGRGRGG